MELLVHYLISSAIMHMLYFSSKNPLYILYKKFVKCSIFVRVICFCLLLYFVLLFPKNSKLNLKSDSRTVYTDPKRIYEGLSELKLNYNFSIKRAPTVNYNELLVDFDSNLPELRKRILRISAAAQFPSEFTNTHAVYSNRFGNKLFKNTEKGSLNVYVWRDICSESIDILKANLGFPYNPWKKLFTNSFNSYSVEFTGQRIFGYILPPTSGKYIFEVSYYGSVEVWLSPNYLPSNAIQYKLTMPNIISRLYRKLLFTDVFKVDFFTAYLVAGSKQYIEIIHATNSDGMLELKWKRPYSFKYNIVDPQYFCPYINDSGSRVVPETHYPPPLPVHLPSSQLTQLLHPMDDRNSIFSLPPVDINGLEENWVFPSCEYEPAHMDLGPEREANNLDLISTFPATPLYSLLVEPSILTAVIHTSLMEKVLSMFMHHIKYSYPSARLSRLVNMEKLSGHLNGNLYLVEVLITFEQKPLEELLVSEYVVLAHRSMPQSVLCTPPAMVIRRDTFIHFLVTQRNLPQMARQFVENMEQLYEETGDENFGVIIVNYETPTLNLTTLLRQSKLKHWSVLDIGGPWEKTAAINIGIDSVDSSDDIIFITDLSLSIPSHLPDTIRKHTFKGYSAFAPIIFYFTCEFAASSFYKGFYSITGYGLFGFYKSDWIKVGGMNTSLYKGKWGWEDNDLADRVLTAGYVLFRVVMRDFYHQNHTYAGLWDYVRS